MSTGNTVCIVVTGTGVVGPLGGEPKPFGTLNTATTAYRLVSPTP